MILDIFFSMLDCFEIFFFFFFLKIRDRRKIYIALPLLILLCLMNYYISNIPNIYEFNIEILLFIVELIIVFVCFKKLNSTDIILLFLLNVISIIEVVGILLFYQYSKITFKVGYYAIVVHILRITTFYFFAKYMKKFLDTYGRKSMNKLFYIIFPLLILLLLLLEGYYSFGENNYYNSILVVSMCVGISLFLVVKKQYIIEFENDKLKMITKMVESSAEQYKILEGKAKEVRKVKHDLLNNLSIVQCLIKEDKKEESITYLSKIVGDISSINSMVLTSHQYLNTLLNFKRDSNKEINFCYQIGEFEMNQSMEFDCCTIISNLLDNAIDELSRNPDNKQDIFLILKEKSKTIIIVVENDLSSFKSLQTEKMKAIDHGLGLGIVRTLVKKYNGEIDIEQGDRFKVALFLKK
ncbi:MAG: GHKL domain-containing protein [Erysipelotrichales bacterium]|nr:GHKL domain-containing protein [Erysipelotrichales bacterium]